MLFHFFLAHLEALRTADTPFGAQSNSKINDFDQELR
jgi:hypothetical protein